MAAKITNLDKLAKSSRGFEAQRKTVLGIIEKGFESADAKAAVGKALSVEKGFLKVRDRVFSLKELGNIYVVGAGKASGVMAEAAEKILGTRIKKGIVNSIESAKTGRIKIVKASHPLPNQAGVEGTRKMVELVSGLKENDLVLCLISGGGSALLSAPPEKVPLKDKQRMTELLVRSAATVTEINKVRKHVSLVKGGRLAQAAAPAHVVTLIVSDVIGDDLSTIASGPTVPDPSTFLDAQNVLKQHGIWEKIPASVRAHILDGVSKKIKDTPQGNEPFFRKVANFIILNNAQALESMRMEAQRRGIPATIFSNRLSGDAGNAAGRILREAQIATEENVSRPIMLLAGGETTVKIKGRGKGGRNSEMVMAALPLLAKMENVVFVSVGSDGIDGASPAAGAIADTNSFARAKEKKLDYGKFMNDNDTYTFFSRLGDAIMTGYTKTNVMDFQVVLIS